MFTLNEILQDRLREDKKIYAFFLNKNEKICFYEQRNRNAADKKRPNTSGVEISKLL